MEIPPEEIQQPDEDNGSLLKKKVKKVKDPNQPKKVLTDGQKKALTAMNDARTRKAEKEQLKAPPKVDSESESSESSSEEIEIITKPPTRTRAPLLGEGGKRKKEPKPKKKTKKIIVIQESSSESESESEPEHQAQPRQMKSQQNRRSIIQQHNEKQTSKNFFCS
jgi:hypothetical protein